MISTRDLKSHIYRGKGLLMTQQIEQVLAAIHARGKNINNRTSTFSEIGYWKTPLPVQTPSFGKAIVLHSFSTIENGLMPWKFVDKAPLDFYVRVFQEMPAFKKLIFHFDLVPKTIPVKSVGARLTYQNGRLFFGFYYYDNRVDRLNPNEAIALIEQIVRLAELPVRLGVNVLEKTLPFPQRVHRYHHYTLHHTMPGGELLESERDNQPIYFYDATFPGASLSEVVERFYKFIRLPEFRKKSGGWFVNFKTSVDSPQADPIGLLKKIDEFGFPGKELKCVFLWHLESYKDFKEMLKMRQFTYRESPTQYLLDFEFGGGKQCQVVAISGKDGKYKLIFALDHKEDKPELSALLNLKLEEE